MVIQNPAVVFSAIPGCFRGPCLCLAGRERREGTNHFLTTLSLSNMYQLLVLFHGPPIVMYSPMDAKETGKCSLCRQ